MPDLHIIGTVRSPLTRLDHAPKQADESAPEAWLLIAAEFTAALSGLKAGDDIVVLTWLDRADRGTLSVHPRGDMSRPPAGVFATRSPHRPNPIGLHVTRIAEMAGDRVRVTGLEALDGTPILDIKIALPGDTASR